VSFHVDCPTCLRRIRFPDRVAGRQVSCPRCDTVIERTATAAAAALARCEHSADTPPDSDSATGNEPCWRAELRGALSRSSGLGALSASLGLLSILLLCVPFVGLVAIPLGGLGLLLGLGGLFVARIKGDRDRRYPLAGSVTCLLAIVLALLPMLF